MKKQVTQKHQFIEELTGLVIFLDATPRENGSTAGKLHRTRMDVKTALTGNRNEAVLKDCIRGEKENYLPPMIFQHY